MPFYFQRGSKGDTLSSLVRAEYGSNPLGESPKVDMGEDGSTEYNFTAKLECTFDDPAMLDEVAYKPVLGKRMLLVLRDC